MGFEAKVSAAFAFIAMVGVGLGAFGAHSLKATHSPEDLEIWKTATLYLMLHAVAGLTISHTSTRMLFLIGIAVFSGSLFTLVLTQMRWLGAVTPVGGISFMAGWLTLGLHFLKGAK